MQVVDAHAHFWPREWLTLFERGGARYGATVTHKGDTVAIKGGGNGVSITPEYVDLDLRLRLMDERGIDVHALSLVGPGVYWAPAEFALDLSQAYNDLCSAAHLKRPDRLIGIAMVPLQAPELAVRELERAAKLPGLRGVYMRTHVNGMNLDDKSFFPVYAKCEELGWPVLLHPHDPLGADRMRNYYLRNLLGNPYEAGVAAACLVFGGVLDAFPGLDVVLPHAGGTFPWLIGRLDHGVAVRHELAHMRQPASAYLRRFHYDSIGHNETIMLDLIRLVGADRVVLGSDYNFDMGCERPREFVAGLKGVAAGEREMILGGNASRLLRL